MLFNSNWFQLRLKLGLKDKNGGTNYCFVSGNQDCLAWISYVQINDNCVPISCTLRFNEVELLNTFPKYLIDKIKTHSLYSFSHHIKCYLIDLYSYDCSIIDCYICNNIWEWQVAEVETLVPWPTLIADRSLGSRNGNPGGGRRLVGGRWFIRFSKDTNGSITLHSASEWIMILFAMASLIELYPS